jgi:hypothetical protein
MIKIKAMAMDTWLIEVDGSTKTEHEVTLSPDYYQKLTGGAVSEEVLIEKSFEFLLARESNTSILLREQVLGTRLR